MFRSRIAALLVLVTNAASPLTSQAAGVLAETDGPSPSGCTIVYITNPHFAKSVPGAVKVNVRAECDVPVPEHDLSVTLLADGRPIVKTVASAKNKAFLMNQGTFIQCKNFTDEHTFQGTALGTSWEDNKPYTQIDVGPEIPLRCGF